ncbi:MAG: efflux RND transporter periplasmic adaptor subunit [Desulfarculaceae bacterium]
MRFDSKVLAMMVGLGLASLTLSGCDGSEANSSVKETNGSRLVKVEVIKVEPKIIKDVLILPGETEAVQDVRLGAERDGRVEWVGPKEGDRVKKGDLIAKVDVSAAKAALDRAEAAFKLAEHQAARRKALHARKALPAEEMDRAVTEKVLAQGNLREARVRYDQGMVRSPIDGRVNKLHVDPGEYVGAGAAVADLVNMDRIRINLNVPELDVRYLKVGQKARVTVDAYPGEHLTGQIDFVAFKADPATKTFKVRVVVDNQEGRIRPGMIARVALLRRLIPQAVTAPLFALVDKGGERLIFVEENGVAHARTVNLGVIDGDQIQITEGLKPGDNLIVTGQTEVEEGTRVVVQ